MDCVQEGMARKAASDATFDGLIMSLWRSGLNTNEISRHARVPEHEIANRLAYLRDVAAQ
jgi:hypothetical protein